MLVILGLCPAMQLNFNFIGVIYIDKERILSDFDKLYDDFGLNHNQKLSKYKAAKLIEDNTKRDNYRLEINFQNKINHLKEIPYLQDYVGMYSDNIPENQIERRNMIRSVLKSLANDTKNGSIPRGKTMSVSKDWLKKCNTMLDKIIDYENLINHFSPINFSSESDILQPLLNLISVSSDGSQLKNESIEQYQRVIKFINQLECLVYNTNYDYSSTIRTPQQQADLGIEVEIKQSQSNKKDYSDSDYNKLRSVIEVETKGDYKNASDIHIAIELARTFGLRLETITELTVDDIKAKLGEIYVPKSKNKSKVNYRAVSVDGMSNQFLGEIIQRAILKSNTNDITQIKIISASKKSLYNSFKAIEKRAGIKADKYKYNRFHALRRSFTNEYFDILIENGQYFNDAKREVDRALGHDPKENCKNLDKYLSESRLYQF